jgi:hypothetical protein
LSTEWYYAYKGANKKGKLKAFLIFNT